LEAASLRSELDDLAARLVTRRVLAGRAVAKRAAVAVEVAAADGRGAHPDERVTGARPRVQLLAHDGLTVSQELYGLHHGPPRVIGCDGARADYTRSSAHPLALELIDEHDPQAAVDFENLGEGVL